MIGCTSVGVLEWRVKREQDDNDDEREGIRQGDQACGRIES